MTRSRRLRSLYICYLSLDDPLVHTQVVAYLRGLAAAGHEIHLLTFEPQRLTPARRRRWRATLNRDGITWHGMRYHKRPSLPATVFDTLAGAGYAALIAWRHRIDLLHARSHVPAAMALIAQVLAPRRGRGLIFDIRGLMAEEYVDAGRWAQDGIPFRLTKAVERRAIARADGIVVLTERVRRQLFGEQHDPRVSVIPCCADLKSLQAAPDERRRIRTELGLGNATVMIYVGKFGGWYMAPEMAAFFAAARQLIPSLHFLVLSQDGRDQIRTELERHVGVGAAYTITAAPPGQVGAYLAAANFGICFIRPAPSKASSSPTKVGEYLGAGLPVVCTAGVGDLDSLITPEIGVLLGEHGPEQAYATAARTISRLVADPEVAGRCRETAQRHLSLDAVGAPRYLELYDRINSQ